MTQLKKGCRTTLIALTMFCPAVGFANSIYNPVVSPVSPIAADTVPDVARVPGKQFTDSLDMTYVPSPHQASPTQIGEFDGLGGARNGLRLADFSADLASYHIDAQSQINDSLFEGVVDNRAPLVVSTSFDTLLGGTTALAVERTGGAVQSFATSAQIVNHPHVGGQLRDIDSVDLWGPEGQSHAAFYSFGGDPDDVAVYSMTVLAAGGIQPYLTSLDIAAALGNTALAPLLDIDALMVRDVGTGFNPFDGVFGAGDSILFSIAPIPNPEGGPDFFDGGEVWTWQHGQLAEFLQHGGHVWDTDFDVQGTLGALSENIDALEAVGVPEPTTMALAVLSLACMLGSTRRHSAECSGTSDFGQ